MLSQTRITTKYTILPPPDPNKPPKSKPRKARPTNPPPASSTHEQAQAAPDPIRATLTLKTYDPVSGTTLKYSTTKAAEVSRLIQILGRLARPMSGLPEVKEDIAMGDGGVGGAGGEGSGVATPVLEAAKPAQGATGGGGGGGRKKKGKGKK
jgi:hypothetical protein